ncbi:MAG: glycosyltransferase family 2 protein [Bacteroidota bacterium]
MGCPVKISAVIITFNEERNIERCIRSLEGIADEIVVLDSFSTDNTKNICGQLGVKFLQHPFDGHIEQKNRAVTHASSPYILSLDADEALSDKLKTSILYVKENWEYDGYIFNRMTNYCGKWIKHCGWYPDRKLRLWDSRKGKWTGENPHDRYELNQACSIQQLKGDLLHYSYYSISQHIRQVDSFTDIAAKAWFERGKRAGIMSILYKPFWKFLRDYYFRLGILDGYYGFVICMISSHATFLKYAKIRELQKTKRS